MFKTEYLLSGSLHSVGGKSHHKLNILSKCSWIVRALKEMRWWEKRTVQVRLVDWKGISEEVGLNRDVKCEKGVSRERIGERASRTA